MHVRLKSCVISCVIIIDSQYVTKYWCRMSPNGYIYTCIFILTTVLNATNLRIMTDSPINISIFIHSIMWILYVQVILVVK